MDVDIGRALNRENGAQNATTPVVLHECPVGASVPGPYRRPADNADRFVATCREADGRTWLLAAVFDGVSSAARSQEAAAMAADLVTKAFDGWDGEDANGFLVQAIREADRAIRERYPAGQALCTAAVGLAEPGSGLLIVAHAGDSAVFLGRDGRLERLTQDHAQYVPVRLNGKVMLRQGMPVLARGLTTCLGAREPVVPDEVSVPTRAGDLLIVATDGAVPGRLEGWSAGLGLAATSAVIAALCDEMSKESSDDTTVVVARLGLPPEVEAAARDLDLYPVLDSLRRHALIARLATLSVLPGTDALLAAFRIEDDAERAEGLIALIARGASALSRDAWVSLLDRAVLRGWHRAEERILRALRGG